MEVSGGIAKIYLLAEDSLDPLEEWILDGMKGTQPAVLWNPYPWTGALSGDKKSFLILDIEGLVDKASKHLKNETEEGYSFPIDSDFIHSDYVFKK